MKIDAETKIMIVATAGALLGLPAVVVLLATYLHACGHGYEVINRGFFGHDFGDHGTTTATTTETKR